MADAHQSTNPIEIFLSYAHKDKKMCEQLLKHLSILKRQGVISGWDDRLIDAGEEWAGKIKEHINSADLILLLVSADFLDSDYCYDVEMARAMERHEAGEARVIPVILRPCAWQTSPFGKLQALPKDAKPVTAWESRDDAFLSVFHGIKNVIGRFPAGPNSSSPITNDQFLPGAPPTPRLLRAPVSDFVGRAEEVEQLASALSQAGKTSAAGAISVVRGMGGMGKTELAYKVAQRLDSEFTDGQLLIELRGESPNPLLPEQALQSIILTFDRNAKFPENLAEIQAMYQSTLAGKRVLILADNAKGAEQVRPLLPPNGCALLITSRQRFTLPGMVALDLDTLPADTAEHMLRQICPRIGDAAPRLAQLCGYLPLALRVSASVLASDDTLRVERYLERLTNERDRLKFLHDPDDPAFDVEASLRLSYDALESTAQNALCQMCVFPASFDLRAVAAVVLPGATDVEELLSLLRRRSLVEWNEEEQRYRLHDLVRVFGATQLTDADAARRRHALYFSQLITSIKQAEDRDSASEETNKGSDSNSGDDAVTDTWNLFLLESANIEAGAQWALEHTGESEADALLLDYVNVSNEITDMPADPEMTEAALAVLRREGNQDAEMSLLSELGEFYLIPNSTEAIKYYEQALHIARELKDQSAEGNILISIGMAHWQLEETQREIECYEKALAISKDKEDHWLEGSAFINIGNVNAGIEERGLYKPQESFTVSAGSTAEMREGHHAIEQYEQALRIWRENKCVKAEAATLEYLGYAHERLGEVLKALGYYEQALSLLPQSEDDDSRKRSVLSRLGSLHYAQGNYTEAQLYFEQLLEIVRRREEQRLEGFVLHKLSDIANQLGNPRQALAYNEQELLIARKIGDKPAEAEILNALGDISAKFGETDQTLAYYKQALPIGRELGDIDWTGNLLLKLGRIYLDLDRDDEAIDAYQEAISLDSTSSNAYVAYITLGSLHFISGRYDDARDAYQRALALCTETSDQANITVILGDLFYEQGRSEEALAAYQRASHIDPDYGHQGLGRSYYLLRRYDEALVEYEQAHRLDPKDIYPVLGLARVHRKLNHQAEFEREVAVARGLIAEESDYEQACLAAVCGDVDEALKLLEAALSKEEVSRTTARRDLEFDFIRDDPRFEALVRE